MYRKLDKKQLDEMIGEIKIKKIKKSPFVDKNCKYCKTTFSVYINSKDIRFYCSIACSNKGRYSIKEYKKPIDEIWTSYEISLKENMNKKCLNCKIEFTPNLLKRQCCDLICLKAYNKKWLYKLKTNDVFITDLLEKDLQTNY